MRETMSRTVGLVTCLVVTCAHDPFTTRLYAHTLRTALLSSYAHGHTHNTHLHAEDLSLRHRLS